MGHPKPWKTKVFSKKPGFGVAKTRFLMVKRVLLVLFTHQAPTANHCLQLSQERSKELMEKRSKAVGRRPNASSLLAFRSRSNRVGFCCFLRFVFFSVVCFILETSWFSWIIVVLFCRSIGFGCSFRLAFCLFGGMCVLRFVLVAVSERMFVCLDFFVFWSLSWFVVVYKLSI